MIVKPSPFTRFLSLHPTHPDSLSEHSVGKQSFSCRSQGTRESAVYFFDIKRQSSTQLSTPAICVHRQREKNNAGRQSIVAEEDSCAEAEREDAL